MKKALKRPLWVLLTLALMLAWLPPSMPSASAQATVQTVTLPPGTPTPWQMVLDGDTLWFAGSYMGDEGFVARINLATVLTDPAGAVEWWRVTPDTNPEGSWYGVTFGVAVGGGLVWASHSYTGADWFSDLVTGFNPATGETVLYWLTGVRGVRDIAYVDGQVWVGGRVWVEALGRTVGALVKLDPATGAWTWLEVPGAPYDFLVDGDTLWVTAGTGGLIQFNLASEAVAAVYTPSSPPTLLAKDAAGNIWFSMNQAQRVGCLDPATGVITEHQLDLGADPMGTPYDAPYGLVFDDKGQLWMAGYEAAAIFKFNPAEGSLTENHPVENMPYFAVKDAAGKVWVWGLGSVDLNRVDPEPPKLRPRGLTSEQKQTRAEVEALLKAMDRTGVYDPGLVEEAWGSLVDAGLLRKPGFAFDPRTAEAFAAALKQLYGENLQRYPTVEGRVWLLHMLRSGWN